MTYWRDTAAQWVADDSLHAGITRGAMQDNATVLGEQAKTHLDSEPLGAATITLSHSLSANYTPSTSWIPQPVRALKTFNGTAWRDISVYFRCELVGAGNLTVRLFLLPREAPMAITAAGAISDYDFVQMVFPAAAAPAWKGGAITPSHVQIKPIAGIDIPIVWMHVYCSGTVNGYIHNVRIVEASA